MGSQLPKWFSDVCVWDIGAMGKPLRQFAKNSELVHMVAFEPNPDEALKIKRNWNSYNWASLSVKEYALGGDDKNSYLNVSQDPGWTSLLEPDLQILSKFGQDYKALTVSKLPIKLHKTNFLIENGQILAPNFVKIDTQGSELDILKGFSEHNYKNILMLQVETEFIPTYKTQPLFGEVMNFLLQHEIYPLSLRTLSMNRQPSLFENSRYRTLWSHTLFARLPWQNNLEPDLKLKLGLLYAMHGFYEDAHESITGSGLKSENEIIEFEKWARKKSSNLFNKNPEERPWRRGDSSLK